MTSRPSAAEQLRIPELELREELAASLRRYIRHAETCGTNCVGSTAATQWRKLLPLPVDLTWMSPAERERILDEREQTFAAVRRTALRLRLELDGIEANRKSRSGAFTIGRRRRRSRAETAVAAQLLAEGGLTRLEIAEELGVNVKTIDNLLSPGVVEMTETLRSSVRGMKAPANRGVKIAKSPSPGASETGSTMRADEEAESA